MKKLYIILAILICILTGIWIAHAQTSRQYLRVTIDLAIPLDAGGKLPPALLADFKLTDLPANPTTLSRIEIIRHIVRSLKPFGAKINAGTIKEENTLSVKSHNCQHEKGLPCPMEEDF